MKSTVAAYVRVSTGEQKEDSQRDEIGRWLKGHGLRGVTWFADKRSGDNLKRPQFEKLQAAIFAGEVRTVVVYKLDRLSRSLRDGINTLTDWLGKGVRIVSVTQQLDFSGATGQLVAAVLFAVAQMEQETRRERQAAGIRVAKKKGIYKGRKAGTTKANPERARELRDKGELTLAEIARNIGVSVPTVERYLRTTRATRKSTAVSKPQPRSKR
jgi:DNA invertase Pin-like site-specific DNA recombinase